MNPVFVIAGPDPQSMRQKAWMPDQVRHDKEDELRLPSNFEFT